MRNLLHRTVCVLVVATATAIGVGLPERAEACVSVARRTIKVAGEDVLLVWDPATHTEHLIRDIRFDTRAEDFGFLVPTPTEPSFGEADRRVFDRLWNIYRMPARRGRGRSSGGSVMSAGAGSTVTVVATHSFDSYTATVLSADDPGALVRWLEEHRYPSSPAIESYAARYVAEGWYFTAFRFRPGHQTEAVRPKVMRMSFQTDRLFFPYAEPSPGEARAFRVSVLAPHPVRARVGDEPWRASVGYQDSVSRGQVNVLLSLADVESVRQRPRVLTVFDEPRSVRGSEDLFFVDRPDEADVRPTLELRVDQRHAQLDPFAGL